MGSALAKLEPVGNRLSLTDTDIRDVVLSSGICRQVTHAANQDARCVYVQGDREPTDGKGANRE